MTLNKQKVIEWANEQPTTNAPYYHGYKACKNDFLEDLEGGRFDSEPSELQVENQKLREALPRLGLRLR
jgi:hypothetical protein